MRGFSLIELAIVMTVLALLVVLAVPGFAGWMANARVRTVAESLQNDMRRAQTEAIRRNRQVAIVLTNASPDAATVTAAATARNWSVRALPLLNSDEGADDTAGKTTFLFGYSQNADTDVSVKGGASLLCFNSVGRLVNSTATIKDAGDVSCSAPTTTTPLFFRAQNGGDRPIWVQAYLGGQLRLCDPNKSGTPAPPDACCTSVCCGISGLTSTNHCKD